MIRSSGSVKTQQDAERPLQLSGSAGVRRADRRRAVDQLGRELHSFLGLIGGIINWSTRLA